MCAAPNDLTAAARIRETATRLFAERGAAAVTIREIAAAAGVSPSLIMHHYGSKDGLKETVDRRATALVEALFSEVTDSAQGGVTAPSLAAALADRLEQEPMLPAYLRRLLLDGGSPAESIFHAMFAATVSGLEALEAAGLVRPAIENRVRAAFLLVNDLALVLLRDQIRGVLGVDPLSKAGMSPWTAEVLDVYEHGVFSGGAAAPGRGVAAEEPS